MIADSDGESFRRDGRGGCVGTGDYANIHDGAPVVVFAGGRNSADGRALMDGTCRYRFAVAEVPTGHEHYYLQVSDRDGALYSEADLNGKLVTIRLSD
ncbi:hypothetical protein EV384_2931 [Micromonospora kangleipakensis]|uniref:Uncharacterized protein n=1 Tax=Micromonospora kangleipakensis TaxID=1077942 RepID=A0A4Q8B9N4_9ACTN|nr:hypothetical protein [Micromonospora kangleipakensis]RZU74464.1 hypothetical protein EV384_2931 [Micromonospora kangleipakensis]